MADPQQPTRERLNIKKYPNRRYYDATRSRHVTLEEIYALVRQGHEVQVTDSRTGEDITARVLAQIIIELDPPKLGVFPVPLLHGLLRSNEQAVTELTRRYFEQLLGFFLTSQKDLGGYFGRVVGLPAQGPTFADWARLLMWDPSGVVPPRQPEPMENAAPDAGQPRPATRAPTRTTDELREQVELLGGQLEALRKELESQTRRRPGRRGGR